MHAQDGDAEAVDAVGMVLGCHAGDVDFEGATAQDFELTYINWGCSSFSRIQMSF
jgi:hypothetical protein